MTPNASGDARGDDTASGGKYTTDGSSPWLTPPEGQKAIISERALFMPPTAMSTFARTAPGRADIARDLLGRVATAETNWAAPASPLTEAQRAAMRQADRVNSGVLRRILCDHGWPGVALVGADGARAAWLIALHADDVEFQKLALAALADAVARGQAEPAHWAHLYDRCCALCGVPQLYGTQFRYSSVGVEPYPVADPDALDERRALYGLEPYAGKADALRRHHAGDAA